MSEDKYEGARGNAQGWLESIEEMLAACDEAGSNDRSREEAEESIHESVLSVLVRDDWHEPGVLAEDGPDEYEILLTTGGPALRIWGKLRHGQPHTAELQMQDWGVPWLRYPAPEALLIDFASRFYFGE